MKFQESQLAHKLLDGLKGIEIGGSAHNHFNLDTINVDRPGSRDKWAEEQLRLCGAVLPVDVEAYGDDLPFDDNSVDFVIASHVWEHFANPVKALFEWASVARKYIFLIIPHAERTGETAPTATPTTLIEAYDQNIPNLEDRHHYGYIPQVMRDLLNFYGFDFMIQDPDDKVGNGFTVVIRL